MKNFSASSLTGCEQSLAAKPTSLRLKVTFLHNESGMPTRCGKSVPQFNIKLKHDPSVFNWEHLVENSAGQNLLANKDYDEFPQLGSYACFI